MYSIKMKLHMDMTKLDLHEVILIKSKQWQYNYHEQLEWIDKNLKASDIHIFLTLDNKSVAYLSLIDLNIFVNNKIVSCWGVGNVCAVERGKGFGYEIMKEANNYISDSARVGLLYCKPKLLDFYYNLNWTELSKDNHIRVSKELKAMVFNLDLSKNTTINYDGQIF